MPLGFTGQALLFAGSYSDPPALTLKERESQIEIGSAHPISLANLLIKKGLGNTSHSQNQQCQTREKPMLKEKAFKGI